MASTSVRAVCVLAMRRGSVLGVDVLMQVTNTNAWCFGVDYMAYQRPMKGIKRSSGAFQMVENVHFDPFLLKTVEIEVLLRSWFPCLVQDLPELQPGAFNIQNGRSVSVLLSTSDN